MTKKYLLSLLFFLFFFASEGAELCIPPSGLGISSVTGTSANISWISPGTETQSEVLVMPFGSPAPTVNASGIIVATTIYTVTGLIPCTTYSVYVRTICGPGNVSVWAGPFTFSTGSAMICTTTMEGNSMTTVISGGIPPYSFSLNGGAAIPCGNTFTTTAIPGNNVIQVTDSMGCSCLSTVSTPNTFSVTIFPGSGFSPNDLVAVVTGGVAPFTYQWGLNGVSIPGATGATINAFGMSGVFNVMVTDANGFMVTATFVVGESSTPVANDDVMTIYQTDSNIAISPGSVLNNDYWGSAVGIPQMTALVIPPGFVLNPDGSVSVLSGTPAGVYTLVYQLCANLSPTMCDTANVVITIVNEGILMNAFIDSNNNGTQELGEPDFTQGQFGFEVNDNGTVNYVTSSNGEYIINQSDPANSYDLSYTINPEVSSQYTLATSSYSNVSMPLNSGIQVYNFPITQMPYHDLAVAVFPGGAPPRPGFIYYNTIMFRNNGNQAIASGTVTFIRDNAVVIVNVSPTPSTTSATGFTYDFTNLLPGEVRYLNVGMQVPTIPTVALGDVLTNNVSVSIPAGDIHISNNTNALSQTIVGSYDPNDKSEAHGGKIVYSDFTPNDYLTYTIQFENTGTFNAENVNIIDVLDEKLDETSVKMLHSSHGYILKRRDNELSWSFIGIDLPPSVANTTTGKGYVVFQVKPKAGYIVGDVIPNVADIFFDFNPPIVTNTFNTEFVNSLDVATFDNTSFVTYPNPTSGLVTVSLQNSAGIIDSVTINDVLGKKVQYDVIGKATALLDLSKLSQGIYFLKIQSEGQGKVVKVVKQ
ncbi:T9SS type A sorting domain-containing protein [Flavobacterium humi]|uniref:T9SS type A sorting domain-containing protein n=1 Tax=Flavobacterium humi TaxID=2562683 RepID=A0A4Z0L6L5_9FLAO|nr:T9SS type A sorting domain-containing protein [Flavobacterium humi]TGD57627.1 T9SS type A sorting domain-containing protein [Flavobacterium humi]